MRVTLPDLDTVGWFNGKSAVRELDGSSETGFGGNGPLQSLKDWTTDRLRVDPETSELIVFHGMLIPPMYNNLSFQRRCVRSLHLCTWDLRLLFSMYLCQASQGPG